MTAFSRRGFLQAAAGVSLAATGCAPRFDPRPRAERSRVAVLSAGSYEASLVDVVRRGFDLFDLDVRGRRVVVKPNLVEFDPAGVINTHPALIAAVIDALLGRDAAEVVLAEGAGHRRDNEYILTASGVADVLRERQVRWVDLNFDRVRRVPLGSRFTPLEQLYLPETVLGADLLISLPKLKTHHWAGVTLSMKNLFGIVPSAIYGWPKNVLHWAGIEESIVDIHSSVPVPRFAIVDGIVGMEGDGPILGDAKPVGALVFGDDYVAVDATCARLMSIDPTLVRHLSWAGEFLGHTSEARIDQIGEPAAGLAQDFRVVPHFGHLKT